MRLASRPSLTQQYHVVGSQGQSDESMVMEPLHLPNEMFSLSSGPSSVFEIPEIPSSLKLSIQSHVPGV